MMSNSAGKVFWDSLVWFVLVLLVCGVFFSLSSDCKGRAITNKKQQHMGFQKLISLTRDRKKSSLVRDALCQCKKLCGCLSAGSNLRIQKRNISE